MREFLPRLFFFPMKSVFLNMSPSRKRAPCRVVRPLAVLMICAPLLCGQLEGQTFATLKGVVWDSRGNVVPNAILSLQGNASSQVLIVHSDSKGRYEFPALAAGSYSVTAELIGQGKAQSGSFTLQAHEVRTIDLTLASATPSATMPEFYDEPQFTVAGVTQTGNSGGHGSDTVQRTSDALAKATASLSNSLPAASLQAANAADLERLRDEIRGQLAREDKPELHHRLAEIDEKLANPLEAVHEYQRAAEMEPSESYVFDWGVELLAHRALEPATEVFTKGH